MFGVSIIVLFEKYLWKSEEKALDEFHLYFMLFAQGRFMSASRIDKKKLIVQLPKCLSSSVKGLRSTSMNGDIADETINLSRAKCTVDATPVPPSTTIDMSVADSPKSTLGKYFKGNIMFAKNRHKLTRYGTAIYKFVLNNCFFVQFCSRLWYPSRNNDICDCEWSKSEESWWIPVGVWSDLLQSKYKILMFWNKCQNFLTIVKSFMQSLGNHEIHKFWHLFYHIISQRGKQQMNYLHAYGHNCRLIEVHWCTQPVIFIITCTAMEQTRQKNCQKY